MSKMNLLFGMTLLVIIFAFRINPDTKKKSVQSSKNFQQLTNPGDTGKKIFFASCYTCHKDSTASLAPGLTIMSSMTPRAILASLNNGKMRQQGAILSEEERKLQNG